SRRSMAKTLLQHRSRFGLLGFGLRPQLGRALIWSLPMPIFDRREGCPVSASASRSASPAKGRRTTFPYVSQKIQKTSKSVLTLRRGADYIRLTNDGGDAAGDQEVRF